MIIRLVKKASSQINSSLIKYWIDDYGNVLSIFSVAGKKYGFIGKPKEDPLDWKVFLGIATTKPDAKAPAGSAEYIEGEELSNDSAEELTAFFKQSTVTGGRIPNGSNVSWSPKSEVEKENLVKLINIYSQINSELKSNGILYAVGDKLIIGEDITSKNVSTWSIPKETVDSAPTDSKDYSPKPSSGETRATPEIKKEEPRKDYEKSKASSNHFLGGLAPSWFSPNDFGSLGNSHANRPDHKNGGEFDNWQSKHAIDIGAPPGTPVYSLTNGVVGAIKSFSNGTNVFGTQISIGGSDGYPDIFYTHTDGDAVSAGDRVRVGDLVAHIAQPPPPPEPKPGEPKRGKMSPHVHVGIRLPLGSSMAQFMSEDGTLKKEIRAISSRQDSSFIKKISSR